MIRVQVRGKPDRRLLQLYYIDPLTGREITRSAETENWETAKRKAVEWELQLKAGETKPGRTSWEAFREKFEDEHSNHLSKGGSSAYGTALNAFEKHIGKPKLLHEVTPAVMSTFKSKLVADPTLASTSVATYLRHVKSALAWARDIGLIREVPRVKMPRTTGDEMRGRPITRREFAAIRQAARQHVDHTGALRFINLLWLSGLRISEALQLSWDSGRVRVDLDSGRHPRLLFAPAGHKARREDFTPIPRDFAAWLRMTPPKQRRGLVAPLVSVQRKRPVRTPNAATKLVSEIGEASGVLVEEGQWATAHDLRRSFGTRWAMQVRPITLQRMMRHKSITTTLKFYIGLECDDVGDELYRRVYGRKTSWRDGDPQKPR